MLQAHAQARAYSAAPNQQLGGGWRQLHSATPAAQGTAGKSPVSKGECRPGSLLRKEELQSKEIIAFDPGNGVVARPACLGDGQATYEMEGGGQIPAAAADHVPPKYILTCSVRHITFIACRQENEQTTLAKVSGQPRQRHRLPVPPRPSSTRATLLRTSTARTQSLLGLAMALGIQVADGGVWSERGLAGEAGDKSLQRRTGLHGMRDAVSPAFGPSARWMRWSSLSAIRAGGVARPSCCWPSIGRWSSERAERGSGSRIRDNIARRCGTHCASEREGRVGGAATLAGREKPAINCELAFWATAVRCFNGLDHHSPVIPPAGEASIRHRGHPELPGFLN